MTFIYLVLVLALHYFTGNGILHLFGLKMSTAKRISLSFLLGIITASFTPFILQLAYLPITFSSVFISLGILCLLSNISYFKRIKEIKIAEIKITLLPSFKIYEWPFIILFTLILATSLWRSFYLPVFARDMLSGPEVIAEYTVKEHTMINSVFTVNLETTNNHHKPPYVADLQIIYKLIGFPFGQIWVSFVAIAFLVFLYQLLKERVHGVIAGTLMLFFFAIPELYAYTYVLLFDYSNMVFFFLAVYFLRQYFETGDRKNVYFSALLFAFATFIRLETLAFTVMIVPALWLYSIKHKISIGRIVLQSTLLVVLPFIVYFLWVNIYLKYYMPAQFHLDSQINQNLADLTPLFTRFKEMHTTILFGKYGRPLWAYFIPTFIVVVVSDLLIHKKVRGESLTWYYAIAVVYFGLPLLGYLLPLMDLLNTTKRGLFKTFPFMLLILANTGILQRLSAVINEWEITPAPVVDTKGNNRKVSKK